MNPIIIVDESKIESEIPDDVLFDTIIINTFFEVNDLHDTSRISEETEYVKMTESLIEKASRKLKDGGLLFVYGLPKYLPFFAKYLNCSIIENHHHIFKYWIALEFNSTNEYQALKNTHIGLLMYLKSKSLKSPTSFNFNTKEVRIPYKYCASCERNIKDWGGKKHLMNPIGSAISDVWSDLDINLEHANEIPDKVIERVYALRKNENSNLLVIKQNEIDRDNIDLSISNEVTEQASSSENETVNKVVPGDSIEYMNSIKDKFPNGFFDLAFADPPYNLSKNYSQYEDTREADNYIEWCNRWLQGMYDVLKPGGALLVLNIPQWAVYHATFLLDKMNFQHWIVWDALSTPAGKLLPAHYSLLYFTKPGGEIKSNYDDLKHIDHRKYCLRISCIKKRKSSGNDDKEEISDVWKDIHRIKHKKDRDSHPCQLPTKLMERIIQLFTDEESVVYDPFGGAGTTAIASKLLNRDYIISDLDEEYVKIAERNLKNCFSQDVEGNPVYIRKSVKKSSKNEVSKKKVEVSYLDLCKVQGRVLNKTEVKSLDPEVYMLLEKYNGSFTKLKNICKRKFESENLLK
jgi:site-specific DNA-methyltransferase (adenine-specific)